MGIVLRGGTIVTAADYYQADVRIEDEKIAAIGKNIMQTDDTVISVEGSYLLPGGIDPHTHFDLNVGATVTADDFASGTAAAVLGGTTTIIDFATQNKGEPLSTALANWHAKASGKSYADYGFHMAITDWHDGIEEQMNQMVTEAGVSSFKLYLAYKGLKVDDGVVFKALRCSKEVGALIGFHCENGDVIDTLIQDARNNGNLAPRYHAMTRPTVAEQEATNRVIALAEMAGAPVYIVHLSCAEALQTVIAAKARGVKVYAETCPQYFLLDESYYQTEDFSAAKYVMSPPLRHQSNQKPLWNGLAAGLLDTVATDHCSFNYYGQKDLGKEDFSKIPNGAPGVENRLGLMYTYGVVTGKISLQQFVALTSTNAAKLFGLFPRKGTIAVGSDADIVVWDPVKPSYIKASNLAHRVDYTPYEGMKQIGAPIHVFLQGKQVVTDGKLYNQPPQGRYIYRKPFRTKKG